MRCCINCCFGVSVYSERFWIFLRSCFIISAWCFWAMEKFFVFQRAEPLSEEFVCYALGCDGVLCVWLWTRCWKKVDWFIKKPFICVVKFVVFKTFMISYVVMLLDNGSYYVDWLRVWSFRVFALLEYVVRGVCGYKAAF